MIRLPRGQALAFRLARHHLATRLAAAEPAAVVGLQDTPPGTAALALAARADVAGLWRPAKKSRKLVVTVEAVAALSSSTKDALAAEVDRLAPFRGADTAELRLGAI